MIKFIFFLNGYQNQPQNTNHTNTIYVFNIWKQHNKYVYDKDLFDFSTISLSPISIYMCTYYTSRVLLHILIRSSTNGSHITRHPKKKKHINQKILREKGISHLASVRIVGNKGYPKRAPISSPKAFGKVQHNVNMLSYTVKIQKAARENRVAPFVLASGMRTHIHSAQCAAISFALSCSQI